MKNPINNKKIELLAPAGNLSSLKQENWIDKINKKIYLPGLFLVILILIGFFFRVYNLDTQGYWIDEGFTYMQMEAIHEHGYPLLDSGNIEVKDMLLPYLLQIVRIFGTNPFWLRFLSAIFGTMTIYVVFLLARYLWDRTVGLFAAFLITFSYWHIAWSRQLRPYTLLVLLIFATLLALALYEKTEKKRYLVWALFWMAGVIFSKSAGILILIPFVMYLILRKHYLFGLVAASILGVAVFVFRSMLISNLGLLKINYSDYYLLGYFWQYFGIMFFLAITGWFLAIKNEKHNWRIHAVSGVFFVTAVIFFSFFVYINQRRYLFFITPLLFMYAAYALALISRSRKKYAFIMALMIVFDSFTTKSLIFIPKKTFALEDYTPQPNFKKAYREIEKEMQDSDCVASPYPYMDKIYLGKSTWALPISYTGRDEDSTGQNDKEHYSGTRMLYKRKNPIESYLTSSINDCTATYFVIDAMAKSRINKKMLDYLMKNGKVILRDDVNLAQAIWVYKIDAKSIGGVKKSDKESSGQ